MTGPTTKPIVQQLTEEATGLYDKYGYWLGGSANVAERAAVLSAVIQAHQLSVLVEIAQQLQHGQRAILDQLVQLRMQFPHGPTGVHPGAGNKS